MGLRRPLPSVLPSLSDLGRRACFLFSTVHRRLNVDRNMFESFVANECFHVRLDRHDIVGYSFGRDDDMGC